MEQGVERVQRTEVLEKEEISCLAEYALVSTEDVRELRKAGLSMGSANKMKDMVSRYYARTNVKTKSADCVNAEAMESIDNNITAANGVQKLLGKHG